MNIDPADSGGGTRSVTTTSPAWHSARRRNSAVTIIIREMQRAYGESKELSRDPLDFVSGRRITS